MKKQTDQTPKTHGITKKHITNQHTKQTKDRKDVHLLRLKAGILDHSRCLGTMIHAETLTRRRPHR